MNSKLFVVTHKQNAISNIPGNFVLLVGAKGKGKDEFYDFRDDDGINISEKNKNYCEMTGVYWIWKNVMADAVGICHYRRFFSKAKISVSKKFFLNEKDISRILINHDIILPTCFHYAQSNTQNESINLIPTIADYEKTRIAIQKLYPEYLSDFDEFLKSNSFYPYNMCIMKKDLFDSYCQWIFDILFWIENHFELTYEDEYRSRLYGFISERILIVWIKHNIAPKMIKEMRVVLTNENTLQSLRHSISNVYRNIVWKIHTNK